MFFGRQLGHGGAHVHHLGVVAVLVFQGFALGVQRGGHLGPAGVPQGHEALALRGAGKRAFDLAIAARAFSVAQAQQNGQVFAGGDGTAAADQGGHEAFTKLPLRGFVVTRAQLIKDGVQLVKHLGRQEVGGVRVGGRGLFGHGLRRFKVCETRLFLSLLW